MKLFNTFFIGGYECADLINNRGDRVDVLSQTFHDRRIEEDYELLASAGIKTSREGIRWSVVEPKPYQYDFSEVKHRILAAQKAGIQQLWDICHFGYPDNLMPSHPQFCDRFEALCSAFASLYRACTEDPLIVTPINEISFLSWLGGDVRGTVPFAVNSGFDLKYFLCKAMIKGVKAIKEVDSSAQIMMVEPLIRIHPRVDEELCSLIRECNENQYQAMDIVTGRICPELGGSPELLDIAGFNYYYNNQWEHCGPILGWCKLKRRACLSDLLREAYERYQKPVVLSETGHFGEDRIIWMKQITEDCLKAMKEGVDLRGICIYPVLDRPDWDHGHNIPCGIWGYHPNGERFAYPDYLESVQECHQEFQEYLAQKEHGEVSQFLSIK
jgi:beta-glucosidase/6-phospho-beta-glucosidase/beta-galactosidase